jgi:predicted PurR-regulated permease PerM
MPRGVAALLIVVLVLAVVIGPALLLGRALVSEASDIANRFGIGNGTQDFRETLESNKVLGPMLHWLDTHFDLPTEATQLARTLAGFASATLSGFITSSVWLMGQIGATLLILFYLLRDQEAIIRQSRSLIPIAPGAVDAAFARIAQTIRVSLGGKLVVALVQGALGGLMFYWLDLAAPVFWGSVMAGFSIFPVIGAFLVWAPAALFLALQGNWRDALLLAGWGVLVVSQIDNLLGPVLIGTRLRMHTLLTFFSIVGGIAAFGASGIVLGPVTVGIVVAVLEARNRGLA